MFIKAALGKALTCCLLVASANAFAAVRCPDLSAADGLRVSDDPAGQATPDWDEFVHHCVPLLTHDRGARMPLVAWEDPANRVRAEVDLDALIARGLMPSISLKSQSLGLARRIQARGLPLMAIHGDGSVNPYDHEFDAWRLSFEDDVAAKPAWAREPDPLALRGWKQFSDDFRDLLRRFADQGSDLRVVILDHEGWPARSSRRALLASREGQRLPDGALTDDRVFSDYRHRLWLNLMSTYYAAPLRESFPHAWVTNWGVAMSTQKDPVLSWRNWRFPAMDSLLFSATNPVAYGVPEAFARLWPEGEPYRRDAVDRVYTHILLRQVSADGWNRDQQSPWLKAVAWVGRWVPERYSAVDDGLPVMSRQAYREALRHLWLRGIDMMAVFNPRHANRAHYAYAEVLDAQQVYDEMLAYRDLLEHGEVMNYWTPLASDQTVLWSGLRSEDEVVVRLTRLGDAVPLKTIELWPGVKKTLVASDEGRTYRFRRGESGDAVVLVSRDKEKPAGN